MTAAERAAEINAKTREWLAAGEGRWAGFISEDPAYYAKYGIHTGLDLARDMAAGEHSDRYKDEHGIRPRWVRYSELSLNEIEELLEELRS